MDTTYTTKTPHTTSVTIVNVTVTSELLLCLEAYFANPCIRWTLNL